MPATARFARHRHAISRAAGPLIHGRARARRRGAGEACMRVLVCGATGCVGRAVVQRLALARPPRGRSAARLLRAVTRGTPCASTSCSRRRRPAGRARLRRSTVDAVVNCVGILMPSRGATFERVHTRRADRAVPRRGAGRRRRIVQVSALGVGAGDRHAREPVPAQQAAAPTRRLLGAAARRRGGAAVARLRAGQPERALFATLASLPRRSACPGAARSVCSRSTCSSWPRRSSRWSSGPVSCAASTSSAAPRRSSYREMLAAYRTRRASARRSGCRCRCR